MISFVLALTEIVVKLDRPRRILGQGVVVFVAVLKSDTVKRGPIRRLKPQGAREYGGARTSV
jgi:hypothetical protein